MAKKGHRISQEIKDQVIGRIKNDGISVAQAATDHGISTKTIYGWLGAKAKGVVSILQNNKLKRENEELKPLIGQLTLDRSMDQKRACDG